MRNLPVTTVILAGGLGTRIGGNKGLQQLHGQALLAWVLEAVRQDSSEVLINANTALEAYRVFGCRLVTDELAGWQGPLAGLQAALKRAQGEYVLTVPCDTPFLPHDLVPRLYAAHSKAAAQASVAVVAGRRQPAIALYQRSVLPQLQQYLASGKRKVNDWLDTLQLNEVVFDNAGDFENINTREELARFNRVAMPVRGDDAAERKTMPKLSMDKQRVIGFAGFSGSGKTTLLEKVIPLLKARGLRIAVIKHAHHKFDIDKPGKDSFRHREAGAGEVLVVSGFRWALMHELLDEAEPTLADLCARLSPSDLVLVEGYKFSDIPKIEVHRAETGHPHLHQDDANFIALASDVKADLALPQLDINQPQQVADFILKYFLLD
jgi:molybdenum cofactor guanylyltransferase/molybdopterin-guanine dinucleotide biosynthesis protein MobB